MKALLSVNTSHLRPENTFERHSIVSSNIKVPVTILDKPLIQHNKTYLVWIADHAGKEHLVDEFFLTPIDPQPVIRKATITIKIETDVPDAVDSSKIMNSVYEAIKANSPDQDLTVRVPISEIKWDDPK